MLSEKVEEAVRVPHMIIVVLNPLDSSLSLRTVVRDDGLVEVAIVAIVLEVFLVEWSAAGAVAPLAILL